jgi:hypothetical protein
LYLKIVWSWYWKQIYEKWLQAATCLPGSTFPALEWCVTTSFDCLQPMLQRLASTPANQVRA